MLVMAHRWRGIFINPYVVAQRVHTPALVLGACWQAA